MKAKIILVAMFTTALIRSNLAQISVDMFGVIPRSVISKCGWGGGINLLSAPVNLGYEENKNHIEMRFGGNFFVSNLNRRNVFNVPLLAPQTGYSFVKLTNTAYGLNAMTRFSLSYSKKFIPYVDIFSGIRCFSADMNIFPMVKDTNYKSSTFQNLSHLRQFNYGATFGVMFSLGENVKINTGLMCSNSINTGNILNVNKAHLESGTIMLNDVTVPQRFLMAIVGITFLIDCKTHTDGYVDGGAYSDGGYQAPRSSYSSGSSYGSGGSFHSYHSSSGGNSSHVSVGSHPSR